MAQSSGASSASTEYGVAYGPQGQYGCYITQCRFGFIGDLLSTSVGFAWGTYTRWENIAGTSVVISVGATIQVLGYIGSVVVTDESPTTTLGYISTLETGFGISLIPGLTGGAIKCNTTLAEVPHDYMVRHENLGK